jgi:hypothetical protein
MMSNWTVITSRNIVHGHADQLLPVCFFPAETQAFVEAVADGKGKLVGLAVFVEGDGLADVVHDDLAGIATGKMFLERLADARIDRAVHVLVQHLQ